MTADNRIYGSENLSRGKCRKRKNFAPMSNSPLSRINELITTCHNLERRIKLDAEVYAKRSVTPADRQLVANRLRRFEETIQIVAGYKQLPEFGTYTFQNVLNAIVASLREMKLFLERSIAVPPLKGLPRSR